MTMQLFSFGHPCEHQLRRTCIGGTSCPLNGYPDSWCCSFIKGKINFKRDKPCEGTRCRWGFTHPSQTQFDAVTLVLNESRPIATKIDDAEDKDLLSFNIDNVHVVDTVHCALHMMRRPPSSCTTRVGQLLAYAAVRTGDSKVFMQLLKTMKKPFDGYLLGAYDYLKSGNLSSTTIALASTTAANSTANNASGTTAGGEKSNKSSAKRSGGGGGGSGGGTAANSANGAEKKESAADELRNGMVDLMNAALSSGGQLVNREDQHTLQAIFIQALRGYPKSNKRRQEMLEAAIAKFGSRPAVKTAAPPVPGIAAASAAHAAAVAAGTTTTTTAGTTATAGTTGTTGTTGTAEAAAVATTGTTATTTPGATGATTTNSAVNGNAIGAKAEPQRPQEAAADDAAVSHTPRSHENNSARASRAGRAQGAAIAAAAVPAANTRQKEAAAVAASAASTTAAAAATAAAATAPTTNNNNNNTNNSGISSHVGMNSGGAGATAAVPTAKTAAAAAAPVKQAPIVGISRVIRPQNASAARHYEPVRTDQPLPNVLLFGGLFGLTPKSAGWSLLGPASGRAPPPPPPSNVSCGAGGSVSTGSSPAADPTCDVVDDKVFHILHSSDVEYNPFMDAEAHPLFRGIYDD